MVVVDVIEESVVVEHVVEIEPTKDEAILLEIQKSKLFEKDEQNA